MEDSKKVERLGWLFFFIMAIPYLMVYFHRVAVAAVSDNLMAEFKITGAILGNLSAMYFYVYTVMQLPAGILADYIGSRKTIAIGLAISGIGSLLFGMTSILEFAYIGRLLIGLGVSVIFVAILKIYTQWFSAKKFGTLSGLTLVVGNTGGLIASSPLAFFSQNYGWRTVFYIIGLVSLVTSILIYLVIRDKPSDIGLPSPNKNNIAPKASFVEIHKSVMKILSNHYSWYPFIGFIGTYGSLMAIQGVWGVPFLMQNYGLDKVQASQFILYISLGLIIGSPLAGYISDRIQLRKLPLLIHINLFLATWLALRFYPGGKPPVEILPYLFFTMGFGISGFGIYWSCAKEINSPSLSGTAIGLGNTGAFLGASILQPLMGIALDQKWTGQSVNSVRIYSIEAYHFAFMIPICFLLVSILFTMFIKETHAKHLDNI